MNDFDPKLRAAMKEIQHVCKKYDVGAFIGLTSESHGEYLFHVPTWSLFELAGPDGKSGVLKIRKEEWDRMTSTMHFVLSIRDMCGMTFMKLDAVYKQAEKHMEIDHKPFGGKVPG